MSKNRFLNQLLATTIIWGAAAMATPAYAQQEDPAEEPNVGPASNIDPEVSSTGEPLQGGEEAIVVTGSRIPQPNLESASPITVVNSQEVKQTGTTRTEDLINSLPQVFAGQGANVANGATGAATLNLRGLGSERTLVLVNGRRLVPGDPTTSAADINVIPAALIQRVDVLTGGASSVYGSDAVAGVVNFIMDTDFEGFRLDGQYSFYQHNNDARDSVIGALNARGFGFPAGSVADGGSIDTTAVFGASFDDGRGHVTAYAGYRKIDPVTQDRRDYSACALSASNGGGFTCGGSATSANGSFIIFQPTGDPDRPFTSTFFQLGSGRTFIPGFTPYNFAPTNYFQRPDERYTAGLFAEYEISEAIQPYLEFMFMDDRTVAQIAPSGDFGNTFSINCDNPLLSAQQLSLVCSGNNFIAPTVVVDPDTGAVSLAPPSSANTAPVSAIAGNINDFAGNPAVPGAAFAPFDFIDPLTGTTYRKGFLQILRRNVEGGPRQDDLQHISYRAVGGIRGDISPVWSYDAYYQYGRTNFSETYLNDFSVTRLGRALDVVTGPDGSPVCRSVISGEDPNCVPYNIFTPGGVTPEAVNYLATPGFQRGLVDEIVASASVTGALGEYGLQSPWSEEGVGFAAGVEYRKESLEFNSDTAFQTGDLAGQGAPTLPVNGSFNVNEVFAEARVPIVSRSFLYDFTITGGYRYSNYHAPGNDFNTDAYKIEAELAPIRDIRFRGGYNRAVRAPTVQDLFAPQRVALDGSTDPCAGRVLTAADAGCLAQGLSVGQFVAPNPAAQYNGLIGGNPNLDPEVADTYTVGVVLQPRFLPGFAASVDYFDISLDQAINPVGADTILSVCVNTVDPFFCSLVQRDQFGSIWRTSNGFVTDITQNIGGLSTKGIDINASYTREIGSLGTLGFSLVGTYLDELVTETGIDAPGLDSSYDCVGLYGNVCGTPTPEWRHQARLTYTSPDGIGLSLRWRYFDAVTIDAVENNTNLRDTSSSGPAPGGVARPALAKLPDQSYFDLAATFRVGDHYNFRLGVNNIFDKDPPLTGSQSCPAGFCNGNTFAQVYDALGRYIYAGVTLDF